MAGERIRSIKPEWLDDEKLASTSDTARMTSAALIVLSDDYGRGRGNLLFLASRIYPYSKRDPREVLATISGGLRELCDCGFLRLYQVAGQDYFAIINWRKHQRVDKPGKPRVPEPPPNHSGDPRETLAPDLGSGSGSGISDLRPGSDRADSLESEGDTEAEHATPEGDSVLTAQLDARTKLEREFKTAIVAKTGNPPGQNVKYQQALTALARWLCEASEVRACPVESVVAELIEGFFAHPKAAAAGFPITFLATTPTEYLPVARAARAAKPGFAPDPNRPASREFVIEPIEVSGPPPELEAKFKARNRGAA